MLWNIDAQSKLTGRQERPPWLASATKILCRVIATPTTAETFIFIDS